ncbi:hypothetical protein SI855_002742 [Clostridioides difficile]|nr:hypothetical protein [Clostridioides difficile]
MDQIIMDLKKGKVKLKDVDFKKNRFTQSEIDEICMVAVKEDGLNLQYVKNKTPEICSEAIKQNKVARMYVNRNQEENNAWLNI